MLINALGTVAILLILGAAFITMVASENRLINRSFLSAAALSAAEAGADFAFWEKKFGGGDFLQADGWQIADNATNVRRSFTGSIQGNNGAVIGDYTVIVTDPFDVDNSAESAGTAPSAAAAVAARTVRIEIEGMTLFDNTIFSGGEVTLGGGSVTDSFDSEIAPYDPADPGTNGNVNTNGDITLLGATTQINGDANPGPDGTVNDPASVTGDTNPSPGDITLPPVPGLADAQINNDNQVLIDAELLDEDTLVFSGDAAELPPGTYYISDLTLNAGSLITLSPAVDPDNPVNIYVTTDLDLSGGSGVGTEDKTAALFVYYTGVNEASITGQSDFCGALYAPNAVSIKVAGGGSVCGSIITGGNVTVMGGSDIHYDEAVGRSNKSIVIPGANFVVAWQEK
ncbi:MAG: hypothetical protein ABIJ27_03185 [Candidatus Omnitrophota bacterium]